MPGTLIILPTFNEAENLQPMAERLLALEPALEVATGAQLLEHVQLALELAEQGHGGLARATAHRGRGMQFGHDVEEGDVLGQ